MSGMHKGRLVLQAKADGKRHVTLPDGRTVETRPEQNTKEVRDTSYAGQTHEHCETQYDRAHPPHAAQEQNSKEVCVLLQKEGQG